MHGQQNKLPDTVMRTSEGCSIEVGAAMEKVLGVLDNFVEQHATDRRLSTGSESMDNDCGGNVTLSS